MSGKGSSPRPFSISQSQFSSNWDTIFGKTDKESDCYCYNCRKATDIQYVMTHMIVCPICGNKRCPHSTDHNLACTNSNEPGQPGSRY
jgi:ribosomal protein L32